MHRRAVLPSLLALPAATSALAADRNESYFMKIYADIQKEARNRELVKTAFDAWAAGTGSPYDLLADDVSWTIVGRSLAARTYASRQAFMTEVIRPFNERMREPLRPTVRDLFADGDAVVIFFDASGVARDGGTYSNTYAWIWEMRDGRVARAHAFYDSISFNDLWRRVTP